MLMLPVVLLLPVKAPQQSEEPRRYSYGMSSDRSWITWHGRNVLWLPLEYRPTEHSCCCIGTDYGDRLFVGKGSFNSLLVSCITHRVIFYYLLKGEACVEA